MPRAAAILVGARDWEAWPVDKAYLEADDIQQMEKAATNARDKLAGEELKHWYAKLWKKDVKRDEPYTKPRRLSAAFRDRVVRHRVS